MIKVSDFILNFIASKNIDTVFTVSGGGCMHLINSLSSQKNIKYICNHNEQACAMAAEGYARVSKKIGCVIVTTGPGGSNCITGVLCAYQDSIPMIIISGQVPTSQLSQNTGCRQIGQQEFNIVESVKNITKYSKLITNKNEILFHLEKAYHLATSGRQGPVWLDIPLDIQSSLIDPLEIKQYHLNSQYSIIKNIIDLYKLKTFKRYLLESKSPVIVIGSGIRGSNTEDKLKLFLKSTGIPVLSGPHSAVDVINNDYEYYCGRFGILGQYTSNYIIQKSDLIICLGSRLNPKMIGYNSNNFAPNAKKIIIDIDNNEIKKLNISNKIPWNIDLKYFFNMSIYDIKINISQWQKTVKNIRNQETLVLPKHESLKNYVSTYVFSKKIESYLNNDDIIVTSNGTAHVVPLKTITLKNNQRLFSNEGTAPMGYGLPAAIGAYFAHKNRIICIEGDGSIMMNLQELETVKYHQIPLLIFIINNEGYLSIKLTQNSFFKGNLVASNNESGVSIVNFKKLANLFDFDYFCISNNDEIDQIMPDIFNQKKPTIIELFCDPNEQHEPKVISKGIDSSGKIIAGDLTDMNIKFKIE